MEYIQELTTKIGRIYSNIEYVFHFFIVWNDASIYTLVRTS